MSTKIENSVSSILKHSEKCFGTLFGFIMRKIYRKGCLQHASLITVLIIFQMRKIEKF